MIKLGAHARTMDQDARWLKIGTQAGKPRTQAVEYGTQMVDLAVSGAQAVGSVTMMVL